MLEFDFTKPYRDQWGHGKGHFGDIGIEIEAELDRNFDPDKYSEYWTAKADGSLRGNGIEFVLNKPHAIGKIPDVLDDWKQWVKGSKARKSPRTSVHVHFNMLGHTLPEILNFLSGFWLIEEWLIPFCGPSRRGNLFCLSGTRANQLPQNIINWLKTQKPTFNQWTNMEQAKYSSINPCTLPKFGSVEIRTMQGLFDRDLILLWINELWRLKSHCVEFRDPKKFIRHYEAVPKLDWLQEIFSKDFFREVMKLHAGDWSWREKMDTAYFDILAISNAQKDWKFKLPEVAKKAPRPLENLQEAFGGGRAPDWQPRREVIVGGANVAIGGREGWRAVAEVDGNLVWEEVFNPFVHGVVPLILAEEADNGWLNIGELFAEDEENDGRQEGRVIEQDMGGDQMRLGQDVFVRNPLEGDM